MFALGQTHFEGIQVEILKKPLLMVCLKYSLESVHVNVYVNEIASYNSAARIVGRRLRPKCSQSTGAHLHADTSKTPSSDWRLQQR